MKAVNEIGSKKTIRFVLFSLAQVVYHRLILHLFFFPPVRKLFLQILGAKVGENTVIMEVKFFNWYHRGPSGLKIGDDCFIGDETLIDLYDEVILENQVTLAPRVTVLTHMNVGYRNHPLQQAFPKMSKPVVFKSGCVVGAGSIILSGITIGKESLIAAGSVVTKDVPSNCLYAGNPAKLLRKIK